MPTTYDHHSSNAQSTELHKHSTTCGLRNSTNLAEGTINTFPVTRSVMGAQTFKYDYLVNVNNPPFILVGYSLVNPTAVFSNPKKRVVQNQRQFQRVISIPLLV